MATTNSENYSYIVKEKHIDAFRVILLCAALAIIVGLVWVISYLFSPVSTTPTVPVPTQSQIIAAKKQSIIQRLQVANTQPLTPQELSNTINFVSRGGATYTEAEKEMITKVLRGK